MNTTRLSLFDHPFFLGFDRLEREFDRLKKTSDGYPPYNVEQTEENALRITVAVAGFTMDDLAVEIENNRLTIRGRQNEGDGTERIFLHRGIAARQFQRSFVLADGIEITGAKLDNGLLHIDMTRILPKSKARKIRIGGADNAGQDITIEGRE
ncbi:MAG: Hsp20 family protein [Proteobacteria bacterium]|nr:Hsp20 family protein [Pseudomonadota bacterium]